jgi:D-3-phosphoglycerate dehydrogenase
MQKPFILINTARGTVVDLFALHQGITEGKVIGACLDVFEKEPINTMNPEMNQIMKQLVDMPNIVVTPHIAGYTYEALYKMSRVLLEKLS